MKAINNFVIIEPIKEEPKKEEGLLIMDQHVDDVRYLKAKIISTGNMTEGIKVNDIIYKTTRCCVSRLIPKAIYQTLKTKNGY